LTKLEQKIHSNQMKNRVKIRIFSAIFAVFLINSSNAFFDIRADDPDAEIFSHLREIGVMNGFSDGNFYPERALTRAEAVAVALKAGGKIISTPPSPAPFADVDPSAWYASAVAHAVKIGVISKNNQNFRPSAPVSKAEFLAFLFRATKVDFRQYFTRTKNIALDVPPDAWFAPHLAHAKKFQIAHLPADNFYRPNEILTRRRAAVMTFRQLKWFGGTATDRNFLELNAQITQFLEKLRAGKSETAEFHLRRITELTTKIAQTKNDENAVALAAISRSMKHFSQALRAFKFGKTLTALENLHLAERHARRAQNRSTRASGFATDLLTLVEETLTHFTQPQRYFSER